MVIADSGLSRAAAKTCLQADGLEDRRLKRPRGCGPVPVLSMLMLTSPEAVSRANQVQRNIAGRSSTASKYLIRPWVTTYMVRAG